MKKATLADLASDLITGATNSLYSSKSEEGLLQKKLLTGSSITCLGEIEAEQLSDVWVTPEKDVSKFVLRQGDVVFLAKGNSIRSAYVSGELAKQGILASANFLVVRSNPEVLLGEALVAYLNSTAGKSKLEDASTGSSIKNVSKASFGKIEIPLPDPETQKTVAMLFSARNEAYSDALKLANQQLLVVDACLDKLIQGEIK
ncbi:restriction endonuclease subunit S [Vibrio splendidus]|uniref:restriction endonuclease subunit S n=1 Tax=unclassified Vibrio TaxID=2614977 RepID=UPI00352E0855